MKKLFSAMLLFSLAVTLSFAASKKDKDKGGNIKLDPKKKFAIEGVELGTITWANAKVDAKGTIIWNDNRADDWNETGWDFKGVDMSAYAGMKIEITQGNKQEININCSNPAVLGGWGYGVPTDDTVYVMFDASGRSWGDIQGTPDPEEGYEVRIGGHTKKGQKTIVKSVEMIKKEDVPDASNLVLLGVPFGTTTWQTHIIGNEVIWTKGHNDGNAGWELTDADLSEYDRIRVELESNDATDLELSLCDKDWNNYHTFHESAPNVLEANLTGEGAAYKNEDSQPLDKSKGIRIYLHDYNNKPRAKECRTVVKSVQLLKGKKIINENLMIEGNTLGSSGWNSQVFDNGLIEWEWDGKDKYPCRGWSVKGVDFSKWNIIRIEVSPETPASNLSLKLYQEKTDSGVGFYSTSNTILEANLDGSGSHYKWENKGKWDSSKAIDHIWITFENLSKAGEKTIIKSVTLLKEDDSAPQPESIMLNGAKLGSKRDNNSWIDDNYAINWKKTNYSQSGWQFKNLEGNILEVKVSSTDVPLRFRIREYADGNEASWLDDGSHVFRIDLKTKKQINAKGGQKDPEWAKMTKAFDFSQGGEIVLEPANGVYKEGKKTVVEYIKIE